MYRIVLNETSYYGAGCRSVIADEIRKRMFVFEDIVTMDDRSVQRFVRECDPKDLVLCTGAAVLEDFKGRLLVAFGGEWSVGFLTKHNPGLELAESLSV